MGNIRIPDGVFFAKGNQSRQSRVMNIGEDREHDADAYGDQPGWITPSWPQSPSETHREASSRHTSLSSSSSATTFAQQTSNASPRPDQADARYSLPRLSTVAPPHHLTGGQPRSACVPGSSYSPLTPEDRKALNSFRVVL